jgi:hypothetical protein
MKRMLINATQPEERRLAIVEVLAVGAEHRHRGGRDRVRLRTDLLPDRVEREVTVEVLEVERAAAAHAVELLDRVHDVGLRRVGEQPAELGPHGVGDRLAAVRFVIRASITP